MTRTVREHFDAVAALCEFDAGITVDLTEQIVGTQDLRGMTVLEIGCGIAGRRQQDYFLEKKSANAYIGLDFSLTSLKVCGAPVTRGGFIQADMEKLPIKTGSIDCVFSRGTVTYARDLSNTLSEIQRVLKPGGCAYLDFSRNNFYVRLIRLGSFCFGWLPLNGRRSLSRFTARICLPLASRILGKKGGSTNRKKMEQVLLASFFSPAHVRPATLDAVTHIFKEGGCRDVAQIDVVDGPAYSNTTTFIVRVQK